MFAQPTPSAVASATERAARASAAAQISDAMTTLTSNAKATGEAVREFGRAAEDLQRAIGMLKSAIAAFHLRG